MEWVIVCPERIKEVFRHLIISFQYELKIRSSLYDIKDMFKLMNKKVIKWYKVQKNKLYLIKKIKKNLPSN